ncbi:hypothetical protein FW320_00435 [Azospirillum sp. Vi22]|uniref:DUF6880 family protein n=1 Tax=Azospirillum baldaniorum TaxID=1064539 RepID=UPI00157B1FF8|nr:DUF6880 family protein [Azospirillum baldaniorum]NUB04662.1 hypothetical protein [Azospirillum baldaniorum]
MVENEEPELIIEAVEALGARRLAEILVEHACQDTGLHQALRLALASQSSGDQLAQTLSREIQRIASDRRFYGYRESHSLAADLDRVRESIVRDLLPVHPLTGAELLGRFIRLDTAVFDRSDDSDGLTGDVLKQAIGDFGAAWAAVPDRDRVQLARDVFGILTNDNYGVHGGVVSAFKEALGSEGLDELERLIREDLERCRTQGEEARTWPLTRGLQQIADARGDVDGFIAAHRLAGTESHALKEICERLIEAGRAIEALARVEQADIPAHRQWEIDDLRVRLLDLLGRHDDAQAVRWRMFTGSLSEHTLRAFLAHLPEGEHDRVRATAVTLARQHREPHAALNLLIGLDLDAAADLVLTRIGELNGDLYSRLRTAAQALEADHPLAAVLLYRSMANAVLARAQSTQYEHAVRDLAAAERLLSAVGDWLGHQPQNAYREQVVASHRQKRTFWDRMKTAGLNWKDR